MFGNKLKPELFLNSTDGICSVIIAGVTSGAVAGIAIACSIVIILVFFGVRLLYK